MGENLRQVGRARAAHLLDPRGCLGMGGGTLPPRQALVGDIADQGVLELILHLARHREDSRSTISSRRRSVRRISSSSLADVSRANAPNQKTRPITAACWRTASRTQ
jgi:hypothetical protein